MQCPKCQFDNPEGIKFCGECGFKLEQRCPQCDFANPPNFKFCGECGHDLRKPDPTPAPDDSATKAEAAAVQPEGHTPDTELLEGERKHVTAIFSDMSGYTAMSERLDPEEVKEITARIFGEISQIIDKYDGFIEKFIGDAVMALFGVPKAHEDDPVRAIKAAGEIHNAVKAISPEFEARIGKPLGMHTGINTGLVVTGVVNLEKETHGVAGDTINVAARLSSFAEDHEIVVGPDTFRHAEGYFRFKALEPANLKGKAEPIQIFRVLSAREQPATTHRRHGLRADLIGREVELTQLGEAAETLRNGEGTIFSISGETGAGKTRLVEEFKASLNLKEIQWLDGQAYAYSQNTPYFPLIDLLNRGFQIKEGDSPEAVKAKIETGIESVARRTDIIPFIGSLYSLNYPETEGVSPEFWKTRLYDAIGVIFAALAQSGPTVICLEDLHWADTSFMALLRYVLLKLRFPVMFICNYRPTLSLFRSHQLSGLTASYHEIRMKDLSPSETQVMVTSLLKSKQVPAQLQKFVRENIGGNPFFVEEVISTLIESETLVRRNGDWDLSRPISEAEMPSTIHGVISARLDHLESESKRILQAASVIGRSFLYDILKRCTDLEAKLDRSLTRLERLDLIHAKSLQPDMEYVFKSALTQEVVYNGLLKKERQIIHERIAIVMEDLFQDRLPEFCETLAFHFKQGLSVSKAVDYLVKAGEKSLSRYAVDESHRYFEEAFALLAHKPDRTQAEAGLLIEILIKWALVFYYRGDFKTLVELLQSYKAVAESLEDKERFGMFLAWLGFSLYSRAEHVDSLTYLDQALTIGEELEDQQIIGYTCAWLVWTCTDLGRMEEAIRYGERAQNIATHFPEDHYLFFKSLGGIGFACIRNGDRQGAEKAGNTILAYGQKYSNIRSMVLGHWVIGYNHFEDNNFQAAIEHNQKALEIAADPFYSQFTKLILGMAYAQNSQFQEAGEMLKEVLDSSQKLGIEQLGTPAEAMLGFVMIAQGQMNHGLKMVEDALAVITQNQRHGIYARFILALGEVYLQIVDKSAPISLSLLAKNIGFVMKNVPSAAKKAEEYFYATIKTAEEIGAHGTLGHAYLNLGFLHKAKGRADQARKCIAKSVEILESCGSKVILQQAKDVLGALG